MYEIFEKLMMDKGITPYRVAKDLSINQSTLSQWKLGQSTPKQDKLQMIADYFNVTIDYLMTGEDSYKSDTGKVHIVDKEVVEIANTIIGDKYIKAVFDEVIIAEHEDLVGVIKILKRLNELKSIEKSYEEIKAVLLNTKSLQTKIDELTLQKQELEEEIEEKARIADEMEEARLFVSERESELQYLLNEMRLAEEQELVEKQRLEERRIHEELNKQMEQKRQMQMMYEYH